MTNVTKYFFSVLFIYFFKHFCFYNFVAKKSRSIDVNTKARNVSDLFVITVSLINTPSIL